MKIIATITVAGMLCGSGTYAMAAGVHYAGSDSRLTVADVPSVTIFEIGPAIGKGGRAVAGTSCPGKPGDPAPSQGNALALMKRNAADRGFNAVHAAAFDEDTASSATKICLGGITARAIAFKVPISPEGRAAIARDLRSRRHH
jgi:hypothetical protein